MSDGTSFFLAESADTQFSPRRDRLGYQADLRRGLTDGFFACFLPMIGISISF
jgi:hypothetical protein